MPHACAQGATFYFVSSFPFSRRCVGPLRKTRKVAPCLPLQFLFLCCFYGNFVLFLFFVVACWFTKVMFHDNKKRQSLNTPAPAILFYSAGTPVGGLQRHEHKKMYDIAKHRPANLKTFCFFFS